MSGQDPAESARIVLEALSSAGQRGVLLTGWGGMRPPSLPETVFAIDSAPHSWLFPRMTAVVHHGGAGTTGEGLRAGVPSVIVPFIVDQPWWGRRVRALGVGPDPIPRRRLTADNLARAVHEAVTNPQMRQRAAELGSAIQAEDGLKNAVGFIRQYLGA